MTSQEYFRELADKVRDASARIKEPALKGRDIEFPFVISDALDSVERHLRTFSEHRDCTAIDW